MPVNPRGDADGDVDGGSRFLDQQSGDASKTFFPREAYLDKGSTFLVKVVTKCRESLTQNCRIVIHYTKRSITDCFCTRVMSLFLRLQFQFPQYH